MILEISNAFNPFHRFQCVLMSIVILTNPDVCFVFLGFIMGAWAGYVSPSFNEDSGGGLEGESGVDIVCWFGRSWALGKMERVRKARK